MRGAGSVYTFSFLAGVTRISGLRYGSLPSCPSAFAGDYLKYSSGKRSSTSSGPKLQMSSAAIKLEAGDSVGGSGTTILPTSGTYKNVVVWLHGLGDTADGWAGSMAGLGLADTKIILPTADSRAITMNGGFQMPGWSDIFGLSADSTEDLQGFNGSADRVRAILESERAKGTEFSRMVIGGFSQGGALALHVCLRSNEKLAGCVACSAWIPMNKEYPGVLGSAAKDIPVSQFHGTRDQVVQFTWGQNSHNIMKDTLGVSATFQAIPGMGHSACEEELESIADFLKKVLPE